MIATLVGGTAFRNPTIQLIEARGGTVFEAAEDEIAMTEAGQVGGTRLLWVGGTAMTLLTVDTKFMPLLPIAMRPDADRGLAIAFGMGSAFRTSLNAGVETDTVELVPSVPGMMRWFYDDADAVLADPRGKVIVADGRNHVELTDQTYDFIVVDPPPPIESSGVSVISTLEFYQASKARLTPDGVMVQWVPYGQTAGRVPRPRALVPGRVRQRARDRGRGRLRLLRDRLGRAGGPGSGGAPGGPGAAGRARRRATRRPTPTAAPRRRGRRR